MQTELRWRLRAVYDRQEIIEILKYLEDTQHLTKRLCHRETAGMSLVQAEERQVFWFLNKAKHWYQPT
jgi:bifunctional ADP-heptose synthase (sugar kinase/adenylyltransferase)